MLPERRGEGIAQRAIRLAEDIHGGEGWFLDTIEQEAGNCHLYEKLGYRLIGAFLPPEQEARELLYGKQLAPCQDAPLRS